jgi:hypothetical protein
MTFRRILLVALLVLLAWPWSAEAGWWARRRYRYVYVEPTPVYVQPTPVYVQPAPGYVPRTYYLRPAPVYVQPAPQTSGYVPRLQPEPIPAPTPIP